MEVLWEKINSDLKNAMRGKRSEELSVLRMLLSALKNKKIELIGGEDKVLNNDQVSAVIKSEVKKRKDAIASYEAGNRKDLADKEKVEIKILNEYLPEEMDSKEIEKIVRETARAVGIDSMRGFGQLMGQVMAKVKNRADGNTVNAIVKKVLSE
ncbi:MAG: GatB/YqeY domain-containing protein [Patescibacteria group bacterium]|nr:GatB/YqeY domain-containing protein [Patescibacteria group bacterium]